MTTKLLDLIELNTRLNVDITQEKQYSLLPFEKWHNALNAVYDELQAWEMKNVGEEQFSKAFQQIVTQLDVRKSLQE